MAKVIITMEILPVSPETDMEAMKASALEKITGFAGNEDNKVEIQPFAFGLQKMLVTFVADEDKGSTDPLEEELDAIETIQSVKVIDCRRALG